MLLKTTLNCVLLAVVIQVALACNGYKVKILKMENCAGPDAVTTIDPAFSMKLNDQCEIVITGCTTNKAFNTAEVTYKISKNGSVLKQGQMDMCAMSERASGKIKKYLEAMGAPTSCPVQEGKICANDTVFNISKVKNYLGMAAGNIVIDTTTEHDTGKSCFHMELEISN